MAAVAVAALLVLGSWLYWVADGSPGTPDEFRDRVADTGLVVEWSNNGHSGGDGVVTRDCGPQSVSVQEMDDALWLLWSEHREELTETSAQAFQTCQLP